MFFQHVVLFHNKTIDQCRAIGRIGGRRAARNRRFRRLALPPSWNFRPRRVKRRTRPACCWIVSFCGLAGAWVRWRMA